MSLDGFPPVNAVELRQQVGMLTFARGQDYFRRKQVVEKSLVYDPLDFRLYGQVRGSRPRPYECRVWLTPPDGDSGEAVVESDSGLCSCPVGFECKHIVALVLTANAVALRSQSQRRTPRWRAQLNRILAATEVNTKTETHPTPVALQFRVNESRNTWQPMDSLELRPVHRGKTGRWVAHPHIRWNSSTFGAPEVGWSQSRWFEDLQRLADSAYRSSTWLQLNEVNSDALWSHLQSARALGIELVGEKPTDTVQLVEQIELLMDLKRDSEGLRLDLLPRVMGGSSVPVEAADTRLIPIGDTGYVVVVDTDRSQHLLLGPAPRRFPAVGRALGGLLPITVPLAEEKGFWEQDFPPLARAIPFASSDHSVQLPEVARPQLVLKLSSSKPTQAALEWNWRYSQNNQKQQWLADAAASDPGRTFRDPEAEAAVLQQIEAIRVQVPCFGPPVVAPRQQLKGRELGQFALQVLPQLRALPGVVVEGELAQIRENLEVPEVQLVAQADGSADWFDLEVTVKVGSAELAFAQVFEALAVGDTHVMADDGSLVPLNHPLFEK
ncbi:MAG: hypothetical protein LBO75_01175, partial [Bifidobacteriaceae bacterium]|nr:hypothetical protein [Bifidobacteriaceae bacterium]